MKLHNISLLINNHSVRLRLKLVVPDSGCLYVYNKSSRLLRESLWFYCGSLGSNLRWLMFWVS